MNWLVWRWHTWVRWHWAGLRERWQMSRLPRCEHLTSGRCDECIADYLTWGHPSG